MPGHSFFFWFQIAVPWLPYPFGITTSLEIVYWSLTKVKNTNDISGALRLPCSHCSNRLEVPGLCSTQQRFQWLCIDSIQSSFLFSVLDVVCMISDSRFRRVDTFFNVLIIIVSFQLMWRPVSSVCWAIAFVNTFSFRTSFWCSFRRLVKSFASPM